MVWVVSANIGRKKGIAVRQRALKRLRDFAATRDVIFAMQEIDEGDSGDEHAWLKKIMHRHTWTNMGGREPIGIPNGWRIESHQTIKTSHGIAKISPTRFISEVVVVARWNKKKRLVILNNHPIAGGFTHPGQAQEAKRREYWKLHYAKLNDRVQHWRAKGETVVVVGDFNHPKMPKVHRLERRVFHHGLDYIIVVPAAENKHPRVVLKAGTKKKIHLGIDGHDAIGIRLPVHVKK